MGLDRTIYHTRVVHANLHTTGAVKTNLTGAPVFGGMFSAHLVGCTYLIFNDFLKVEWYSTEIKFFQPTNVFTYWSCCNNTKVYHDFTTRGDKTSLSPPLLLKCRYQARKVNGICLLWVSCFASFYDFDFGIVPTVLYSFVFQFIDTLIWFKHPFLISGCCFSSFINFRFVLLLHIRHFYYITNQNLDWSNGLGDM